MSGASTVTGARNTGAAQVAGPNFNTGNDVSGWIRLRSRTGGPGSGGWRSGSFQVNTAVGPAVIQGGIIYTAESTNITSLTLLAASNALDTGSYMTVRKLRNPS